MTQPISVVFLGSSAFAVPALRALSADPAFRVEAVVTQPDRPVGRKQTLTPPPVKTEAEELGIPVFQPESLNREFGDLKKKLNAPAFLVVVSYGQLLSEDVLNWPTVAPVNVHASLLPELRGASPLQHAVLQGKSESGVTVQRMVKELDAGPILSRRVVTLTERETFQTLHDRLADLGAELLVDTLKTPHEAVEQRHEDATFCGKLKKSDGAADPSTMDAAMIDRMVRALTPWPGVTLHDAKLLQTSLAPSGESMELPCANGTMLHVVTIQPAGGKPMSGAAYTRGNRNKS